MKCIDQDRPDIVESVKCLAQHMAKPWQGHMQELKRLARYLKGRKQMVLTCKAQKHDCQLEYFTDSDWAGDL